jgi:hypothetical protein
MGIMGLSILALSIRGPGKWKRANKADAYSH